MVTKFNKALFILVILNLASKLALLGWNGAEYTDSIYYLTIWHIGRSKWMPVYPFLIQFTKLFLHDPTLSGRLTSIIMSTLSILPFYAITKRFYKDRAALYSTLLYIVSPVITRWSIRVMTEASFAFFILLSLWCLIKWFDNRKGIYGSGFVAFSGIAALTRPEGIGLLPAALAFAIYMVCKQKLRALHWIIIGLLPWIFQIFWHCKIVGKYGYGAELQGGIHQVTLSKFFSYMLLYPAYLPYIVSPFVFFFVIYGIYRSIRLKDGDSARKIYHLFMFYTVAAWILGLSFHWAWTTRFMFAIIALLLMFSGYGISCMGSVRSRKIALTLSVATSIAFTILVLVCSRGTFEDIRKSSYFIRDNVPPDAKIVSSEIAKIKFWSGRKVSKYNRAKLKPGMYVALQNLYCDFEQEMNYLKEKHDVEVVYRKKVTVVPLLSDEMHHRKVKRKDGTIALRGSGNRLISLRGQFSKHRFESAVILIKD